MNKDSPHIWPAWCILQLTTYLGSRACVYACSRKTRDLLRICVDGWASASLSLLRLIGPAKTTRFGIEIGGMDSERVRKNVEGRKLMDYSGISQSDTIPHFLPYLSLFHEKVARNKQVQCVCGRAKSAICHQQDKKGGTNMSNSVMKSNLLCVLISFILHFCR